MSVNENPLTVIFTLRHKLEVQGQSEITNTPEKVPDEHSVCDSSGVGSRENAMTEKP